MRLRLSDLPLDRPIGRLAWRWPDGGVSGLVYRLDVDPVPHVTLSFGDIRQLVAFIPGSRDGWTTRAFLCSCGHRTRILYMPRNGDLWRCKWCYRLTPAIDRDEGRVSQRTLGHCVRWATIAARSRVVREQPRAMGAALFGPSAEWSTMDEVPPLAPMRATVGEVHRF